VKFPIGGKAREPFWQIRLNSEADSIVWIKEDRIGDIFIAVFLI